MFKKHCHSLYSPLSLIQCLLTSKFISLFLCVLIGRGLWKYSKHITDLLEKVRVSLSTDFIMEIRRCVYLSRMTNGWMVLSCYNSMCPLIISVIILFGFNCVCRLICLRLMRHLFLRKKLVKRTHFLPMGLIDKLINATDNLPLFQQAGGV